MYLWTRKWISYEIKSQYEKRKKKKQKKSPLVLEVEEGDPTYQVWLVCILELVPNAVLEVSVGYENIKIDTQ